MWTRALGIIGCLWWLGGPHNPWVVKPEGVEFRTWSYTVAETHRRGHPGGEFFEIVTGEARLAGRDLYVVWNDGGLLLLSLETGSPLGQWDLEEETKKVALRPDQYLAIWEKTFYEGSLFGYLGSQLVEWQIGSPGWTRKWEMPIPGRQRPERVDDWLVIPYEYPDRCELVGVDLARGSYAWRSSVDRPETVTGDFYIVWYRGRLGQVALWEIERWGSLYFAIDISSGEVISLDSSMPRALFAHPAYAVHLDTASNLVTVLREQQIAQRRRGTSELVWRGHFSEELRPVGMFAVMGSRVFVEFEALLKDPAKEAELQGTYVLHPSSGARQWTIEMGTAEFPLRGLAAIDLPSGELRWVTTVNATTLGVDPAQVRTRALKESAHEGRSLWLEDRLPRTGPVTIGDVVIMQPITLTGKGGISHYLVALEGATGDVVFIYATPPSRRDGDNVINSFLSVDRIVCFGTRGGSVYGFDLSQLLGKRKSLGPQPSPHEAAQ